MKGDITENNHVHNSDHPLSSFIAISLKSNQLKFLVLL